MLPGHTHLFHFHKGFGQYFYSGQKVLGSVLTFATKEQSENLRGINYTFVSHLYTCLLAGMCLIQISGL